MKYTGKIPYGINQTGTGSVAVSVENVDVAEFTSGSLFISGSVSASSGFTGSLFGTASYASQALTASYAVSASHEIIKEVSSSFADTASYVNPLVQDVEITGSLDVTGGITGSLFGTSSLALTASYVNPLTQSVSISGSILVGENSSSLYTSRTATINSGSTTLYSIPTSSYDAVYFDYVIKSGSNARAGQVFSTYSTTTSTYVDNSTSDIGTTSVFYFSSSISSSNLVLHGTTTTDGWSVKTIIRGL